MAAADHGLIDIGGIAIHRPVGLVAHLTYDPCIFHLQNRTVGAHHCQHLRHTIALFDIGHIGIFPLHSMRRNSFFFQKGQQILAKRFFLQRPLEVVGLFRVGLRCRSIETALVYRNDGSRYALNPAACPAPCHPPKYLAAKAAPVPFHGLSAARYSYCADSASYFAEPKAGRLPCHFLTIAKHPAHQGRMV